MSAADAVAVPVDVSFALVIDDDAAVRRFIAATLVPLGMGVATFQTAKEALAALDQKCPAIIFLDVALLQSDAIDVLRGLGARHYGGTVQLMSGGRPSLLDAIQRIGVRHGIRQTPPLNKPLGRQAIVQAVESLRQPEALSRRDGDAAPPSPHVC